jgi:hypothetical protein
VGVLPVPDGSPAWEALPDRETHLFRCGRPTGTVKRKGKKKKKKKNCSLSNIYEDIILIRKRRVSRFNSSLQTTFLEDYLHVKSSRHHWQRRWVLLCPIRANSHHDH